MGGVGGVGPGMRRSGVSCVWGGDRRVEGVAACTTWTYQQEMIGMVNLRDRVIPHLELKFRCNYGG